MERLFPSDVLSKRERVERTLNREPVDRVALHEQLGYNPGVVSLYTGKPNTGFTYTREDVCEVIRQTLDLCFPPATLSGADRYTTADGFVLQNDNWTRWHVSRPFSDPEGARDWLSARTRDLRHGAFDAAAERDAYHGFMRELQALVGDTVILNCCATGFCNVFDSMGLELFTFFYQDYPEVMAEFMEASTSREVRRVHAVADPADSPVVLLAEDFSTKHGPIFSPTFLHKEHFPYVRRVVDAWHEHGVKVLYHSDGNYKMTIPDLIDCQVDGFYCLEPNCGMDIVELKTTWPRMVWAGGVDGVDLMEFGEPEQVRAEVHRHIRDTNALETGGMFVSSSSEINPPIKPENFKAMVDAVGDIVNPRFSQPKRTTQERPVCP